MKPCKNYIDEKGVYHNVQNYTLTEIYDSGVEEGYRIAKQEQQAIRIEPQQPKLPQMTEEQLNCLKDICSEITSIIKDIMPQIIEAAKDYKKLDEKQNRRSCASCDRFGEDCGLCEANDDD